jgi:hypothetical protein
MTRSIVDLEIPKLASFVEQVTSAVSRGGSILRCAGYFAELLSPEFLVDFINTELSRLYRQPDHYPPYRGTGKICVYTCSAFELLLSKTPSFSDPSGSPVMSLASDCLVGALGPDLLRIRRYRLAPINDDATVRPDVVDIEQIDVAPGESLHLQAGAHAFRVTDDRQSDCFFMTFSSARTRELLWEIDPKTPAVCRAVSADVGASRIEYVVELLGRLADPQSLDTLKILARDHPAHFVRWSAIKALARIDPGTALQNLRDARFDCHPHIRDAAVKSLTTIDRNSAKIAQKPT